MRCSCLQLLDGLCNNYPIELQWSHLKRKEEERKWRKKRIHCFVAYPFAYKHSHPDLPNIVLIPSLLVYLLNYLIWICLQTRQHGSSFLAELKQRLLLSPSEAASSGTRYNVPLINSLVLYAGMQVMLYPVSHFLHVLSCCCLTDYLLLSMFV